MDRLDKQGRPIPPVAPPVPTADEVAAKAKAEAEWQARKSEITDRQKEHAKRMLSDPEYAAKNSPPAYRPSNWTGD